MRLNDYCFKLTKKENGSVSHCTIRDVNFNTALIRCQLMYSPALYECKRVPAVEKLPFTEF